MRPTMLETFMEMAYIVARRSTCLERQVGCIIASPDFEQIYSIGYNGNYKSGPNICDPIGPDGKCGCIHAEVNALIKCSVKDKNKKIFITLSPCINCAKLIINSGASAVYYGTKWKNNPGVKLLENAGIPCIYLPIKEEE